MVYWKIDEQTIRCLINKDEIDKMGFDLNAISRDASLMANFLDAIVDDSHKYIEWDTENGVQNYVARALPADQYLITISCTFQDDAINQDLDRIRQMFEILKKKVTEERIDHIRHMEGREKEEAFASLSKDLHDVCTGRVKEETNSKDDSVTSELTEEKKGDSTVNAERKEIAAKSTKDNEVFPSQRITFDSMNSLLEFCSLLDDDFFYTSKLYRYKEEYSLFVEFDASDDKVGIITFLITAEEFGAKCESRYLEEFYYMEHAELLIEENAVEVLHSLR